MDARAWRARAELNTLAPEMAEAILEWAERWEEISGGSEPRTRFGEIVMPLADKLRAIGAPDA